MDHKDTLNWCFLLGGHDLEMLEIRHLLDACTVPYLDGHLNWSNACLSAYREYIEEHPGLRYLGVELRDDITPPPGYTRIDHHNDYSDRPASILQVAELLGISPDRHLQLVAANDAGYIPAMLKLGASAEEVSGIRRLDREAQGVTPEEELLAEKSIAENLTVCGDTLLVRSLSPRFSPICDRLFPFKRLFIFTEEEWTFYGDGASELVLAMEESVRTGRIFFGGGPSGYIGSVRKAFTEAQIEQTRKLIVKKYAND